MQEPKYKTRKLERDWRTTPGITFKCFLVFKGDFVALLINRSHIQFLFDLGSGIGNITYVWLLQGITVTLHSVIFGNKFRTTTDTEIL